MNWLTQVRAKEHKVRFRVRARVTVTFSIRVRGKPRTLDDINNILQPTGQTCPQDALEPDQGSVTGLFNPYPKPKL